MIAQVSLGTTFASIAWTTFDSENADHACGFLVGGHSEGSVSLWDMTAIINSGDNSNKPNLGLIQNKKFHKSAINAIKFNVRPNIFATGSNEIVLISIDKNLNMDLALKCEAQDEGVITSLSWNDKVPHVLAAASSQGTVYIWDMKKSALHLTITDSSLLEYNSRELNFDTNVLWSSDGFEIIIAYDHPDYNFLVQYDMRQPNSPSNEFHSGHSKSIYNISKNMNDPNFILSLGHDNTVACWSIRTVKNLFYFSLK